MPTVVMSGRNRMSVFDLCQWAGRVKGFYDLRACLFALTSELIVDTCRHRRLLLAYPGGDKAAAASITRTLIMSRYRAIERSGLRQAAPGPPRPADQEDAP